MKTEMNSDIQSVTVTAGFDGFKTFQISRSAGAGGAEFRRLVEQIVGCMSLEDASEYIEKTARALDFDPARAKALIAEANKKAMREFVLVSTDKRTGEKQMFSISRDFFATLDDWIRLLQFMDRAGSRDRVRLLTTLFERAGSPFTMEIARRLKITALFELAMRRNANSLAAEGYE